MSATKKTISPTLQALSLKKIDTFIFTTYFERKKVSYDPTFITFKK